MKINFLVNPVFDGWSPKDTFLGGTEESIVEWAKRLQKYGHQVIVYYNGPSMWSDDVAYKPRREYRPRGGVTINVKSPEIPALEKTFYLTNEVDAAKHNLKQYWGVILPSRWAVDNLKIDHEHIHILPHGFDEKQIYPEEKVRDMCLYASSPDRGLYDLVQMWPRVIERRSTASLVVTYGAKVEGFNIKCSGFLNQEQMSMLFRKSDFWLHPCNGGELYCMTGQKAQASGGIPVYYPTMALTETVRNGIQCNPDNFVDNLINIMENDFGKEQIRRKLANETYVNWDMSTDILEEIIKS